MIVTVMYNMTWHVNAVRSKFIMMVAETKVIKMLLITTCDCRLKIKRDVIY